MRHSSILGSIWNVRIASLVIVALALPGRAHAMDNLLARDRYDFQVGVGYAEETHEGSPTGSIAVQAGFLYDCHVTPFDYGLAVGYYDLGDLPGAHNISLSVIPVFAQAVYTFPTGKPLKFFLAGGAGAYVARETGSVDENHTYLGLNGAAGLYSVHGLGRLGYGLEGRFHGIFTHGEKDPRYLSLVGSLYID